MAKPIQSDADEEDEESTFADNAEELFDAYDLYIESWETAEDMTADIVDAWLEAEDDVIEVPQPPAELPVAESHAEIVKFQQGDRADAINASIKRGQELFVGKVASCSKCHGEKGLGNGTTNDYDDWTKDWTSRAGLKPEDRDRLIPLLARGALPPVNAIPRNFAEGVFRGGGKSEDLYRRIVAGIAGTPMPAATFVDGEFEQDDVWHIINFIRSLQTAPSQENEPAETAPTKKAEPTTPEPTLEQQVSAF
ncbi:MAG: c-type cytochrome [Pirellulaceae bacterium]|nr:c-type cytochrome [Pirellulaceae bacterium]